MTTTSLLSDVRIEKYLTRLQSSLRGVAEDDKQDILREIRAHIVDSAEHAPDPQSAIDRTLRLLGTPEELASRYSTECQLRRASSSFSPWLLFRTCWNWAQLGIKGTLAFFLALFGYGMALGCTVSVFIKPFVPKLGLWTGPEGFGIIIPDHADRMHELLGSYFIPVIAVIGFVFAIATTQILRWMMRQRTPRVASTAERSSQLAQVQN
jgi:uncharacterized membrane protein